jgi:alanine racemase
VSGRLKERSIQQDAFLVQYFYKIMRNTYCEISLTALKNNFQIIKDFCGTTKVCAVIKANAYGHGLVEIARTLETQGVDYFAVAIVEEGIQLRYAGIQTPILILAGIEYSEIDECIKYGLTITASSLDKLMHIAERGEVLHIQPIVHLKIDTGMNRIGVHAERAQDFINIAKVLSETGRINCEGIYSHFADTLDTVFTEHQYRQLRDVIEYAASINLHFPIAHICSSRATFLHPEFHLGMVRIGIALYGIEPECHKKILPAGIIPILSWKSKVVYFKVVSHHETVGYGRTWAPQGEYARIVTIPVGYADGFPRRLSQVGQVIIRGRHYDVAGRICMDQTMIDLGMEGEAYVGDQVILIGNDGDSNISAESIAEKIQTTPHEITTCISNRVPRIFIE